MIISKKKYSNTISFYQFVLPAFILYGIFFIIPLIGGVLYSFTDWNGINNEVNFVGFKNYIYIFTRDERFISSLLTTIKLAILYVIMVNFSSLFMAILLNTNLVHSQRRKNIYRSMIFIPNSISLVIVAFIWQFIFTKVYSGFVSEIGLKVLDISWFKNGVNAFAAVLIVMIWQSVGYYMVVYIAGLQTIDQSLIEAADMDGASGWKKFIHLTIPLIIPSIIVNFFISIATGFKVFDIIFQMTSGGPNNTTSVVALNIYQEAFLQQEIGIGSSKAIILCIIIISITYFQIKFFKRREVEM